MEPCGSSLSIRVKQAKKECQDMFNTIEKLSEEIEEGKKVQKMLSRERSTFKLDEKITTKKTFTEDEIIRLNVGGHHYDTLSSTINQKNSIFSKLFDEKGESPFPKDSEGRYFIDRDSKYFRIILNALRTGYWPILYDCEDIKMMLKELHYYQLDDLIPEAVQNSPKIYVIGGTDGNQASRVIQEYNPITDTWFVIDKILCDRAGCAAVTFQGSIYIAGGDDGRDPLSSFEQYSPIHHNSILLSPMLCARSGLALSIIDDYIYALGGSDGNNALKSVEKYDPIKKFWKFVSAMNHCRGGLASVSVQGNIYVMGGYDGISTSLANIEKYDALEDKWTVVTNLSTQGRGDLAATSIGNNIYILGGYDIKKQKTLSDIHCLSILSKKSEPYFHMLNPRAAFSVATIQKKVFAIGGFNGATHINFCEVLDMKNKTSTSITPMKIPLSRFTTTVLGIRKVYFNED